MLFLNRLIHNTSFPNGTRCIWYLVIDLYLVDAVARGSSTWVQYSAVDCECGAVAGQAPLTSGHADLGIRVHPPIRVGSDADPGLRRDYRGVAMVAAQVVACVPTDVKNTQFKTSY